MPVDLSFAELELSRASLDRFRLVLEPGDVLLGSCPDGPVRVTIMDLSGESLKVTVERCVGEEAC